MTRLIAIMWCAGWGGFCIAAGLTGSLQPVVAGVCGSLHFACLVISLICLAKEPL